MISGLEKRPEIHIGIGMDMAVDHVGGLSVFPRKQGIMAERHATSAIGNFQIVIDTDEIMGEISFGHPLAIMIAKNEVLFTL